MENKMKTAKELHDKIPYIPSNPVIGIFSPGDPRIDQESRSRCQNIIKLIADKLANIIKLPNGENCQIVYSSTLIDGEREADIVANSFKEAGVNILVGVPDSWSFPQLTTISLLQQFPKDTPINLTCGNSGPKPGVVYAHATCGAIAQYGRLCHLNVGTWDDKGQFPNISESTIATLADWCFAAVTTQYLKGKRVAIIGHDSMGMETALAHIIPTRNQFGLEITRIDMKIISDMLKKESYSKEEVKELRAFINKTSKGVEIKTTEDDFHFNQSLAMYLIVRDYMKDINAIGGGFMSQLEWGSDKKGIPLPTADIMECFFNSTFDHKGKKSPIPFATEADTQALLTMLVFSCLTAGKAPLFMDFRKVWESWEIIDFARKNNIQIDETADWVQKGFVDGNNSGSSAFDWAGKTNESPEELMSHVSFPLADTDYFPGGGNAATFISPGGIEGIAGRLMYSSLSGLFSLSWDEAITASMPDNIKYAFSSMTDKNWPHTFVIPKYATMMEYKHLPPANHLHMIEGLTPARLEYWMDLNNVLSQNSWSNRPKFIEGLDRPMPLLYAANGGEDMAKMLLKK